ncbi:2-hydroxychromene-2-carboxylate isomerase [Denitromonas halophila]|uniref:2-hydroxychromene-2-carboxylate isomerase n=1 Tax=Denitromonas halophila TaxID=1629404 RepID=A0A557R0C3_9RHOO|nr:2-hydroxychromene-2-carboxylate isomerase [Denitromonas halophila]TVO58611.1 2-hydroxychromene-2-carboxylate isomerase [Denitromonas halophila]
MTSAQAQLPRIEFWFDPASTYSYIAAADVARLEAEGRAHVDYRPFLLGPIFARQGWADSPFNLYPAKGDYMWRDLARLCAERQLPLQRPSRFPRHSVLSAGVALVGLDAGWGKRFVMAMYRANFGEDVDIATTDGLARVLRDLDLDPAPILADASAPPIRARLRAATGEAVARGVFGAPSFFAGDTLFWGTDRLDTALRHAQA